MCLLGSTKSIIAVLTVLIFALSMVCYFPPVQAVTEDLAATITEPESQSSVEEETLHQIPDPVNALTWPAGSALTAAGITPAALILNWTAVTDDQGVTAYKIYKDGAELATIAGDVTTYEVTGLSGSTQYTFRVDAGDECNNWSEGPSTTVTTPEGTAAAPILLTAQRTAQGDISLTFDKPMADPAGTESQFAVNVDSNPVGITAVELTTTPEKIKLVLGTKITAEQYAEISYTKGTEETKQVKATDGGILETFEFFPMQ